MLSDTYTITDIKSKLFNDYEYYGYDADADFDSQLENICDDVKRLYFYPRIGESDYTLISDKDKTDLSTYETNLYWAEVFTVCYEFLKIKSAERNQLQSSANEELTVEGYKYKVSGGGEVSSLNDTSVREYYRQMYCYWKLAGFNLAALERTCTVFGDSRYTNEELDIIE